MKKKYNKILRLQSSRIYNKNSKQSTFEGLISYVSKIRQFVIELAFIGLAVFAIFVFIKEARRTEIILDAIDVPEDLVKLGYTGIVLAEKLADESHKIDLETRDLSAHNSWGKEAANLDEIGVSINSADILLPIAQTSVRSITRFIKQELEINSIYIRGEIVHENDNLVLTLRKTSGINAPPAERVTAVSGNIEQLIGKGGNSLLKLTTPAAVAMLAYHKFTKGLSNPPKEDNNFANAVEAFEYCLKYAPTSDDSLAYTLFGAALIELKQPDKAIEQLEKADQNYAPAYNNRGNALVALKRPQEAIEQYRKAVGIDPNYAYAYNNWGAVLFDLKRPEEAIEQYRKAVRIDPNYAYAYYNWGLALSDLKRPQEAIEQYRKAVGIEPNYALALNNWGNALLDLKRPEEAIEKIKKAEYLREKR